MYLLNKTFPTLSVGSSFQGWALRVDDQPRSQALNCSPGTLVIPHSTVPSMPSMPPKLASTTMHSIPPFLPSLAPHHTPLCTGCCILSCIPWCSDVLWCTRAVQLPPAVPITPPCSAPHLSSPTSVSSSTRSSTSPFYASFSKCI